MKTTEKSTYPSVSETTVSKKRHFTEYLVRSTEGRYFIDLNVFLAVGDVLQLQQDFFRTRDKRSLDKCKAREQQLMAFISSLKQWLECQPTFEL